MHKTIASLKADYVKFYADAPIQKYAAMSIGRDEDTIIRWKKSDRAFADAVMRAKAEFIRKMVLKTKAEFLLERLEKEVFGRRNADVDLTVNVPAPFVYLPVDLPYEVVRVADQAEPA